MKFFLTSEGRLHTGRIAGCLFALSLLPGCNWFRVVQPLCLARIVFAVGWWLAFCGKLPALDFIGLRAPLRMTGLVLILVGLVGGFYFVGRPEIQGLGH